jgi:hypothetical protein
MGTSIVFPCFRQLSPLQGRLKIVMALFIGELIIRQSVVLGQVHSY